ncbi:T9SS type A sorting domain-containing protein [Hymenobacter cheonanensis]|uniref:T9SS type A sorting domain-containing protein n=1 Tax=Hymenobacter sp. CA2-7 TaxID=3063993 RepID=UPI002712937B|nr:T9SS type A sorting domain-containing protein [Hymenobacter sp. CA2-7]MDO7885636.1 T9SS type A sorting domain-containing protein [Hymenobacter sp. CA2-7]
MAFLLFAGPGSPLRLLKLLLLVAVLPHLATAQAPAWRQAVLASGGISSITTSATDASGNVYVAGTYYNSPATFGATTLPCEGLQDAFIAKWSPATGQFVWAQRMGGNDGDFATALAVSGNTVYVTGVSNSYITYFGSLSVQTLSLGGSGTFIAKLTDLGSSASFVWAHGFQTSGGSANALVVAGSSLYLAGSFNGRLAMDGTTLLRDYDSVFGANAFVLKLTDAGTGAAPVWAQQAGGNRDDYAVALAVVGSDVYVAGNFTSGTATFGPFTLANADPVPTFPNPDVFVAKLTDAGASSSFGWVRRAGGTGYDYTTALAAVGPNLYVAGTFNSSTASFGNQTLATAGGHDAFVAKLVDAGPGADFQWAQRAGGPADERLRSLAVAGNRVYVAGSFQGTATFGSAALSRTSQGSYDGFVAYLPDAGASASFGWVQTAGGPAEDNARTLALLPAPNLLYVGGDASQPATFGALTPTTNAPYYTSFAATLGSAEALATVPAAATAATLLTYPNPAHGRATVVLPTTGGPATLTLFDALGRVVRTRLAPAAASAAATELDLTGLAPGVYALRVAAGGTTATTHLAVD